MKPIYTSSLANQQRAEIGQLPHGMTPDELLECVGPSWSAMTPQQRERHGVHIEPLDERRLTIQEVAEIVSLVLLFPRAVEFDGLAAVARRWQPSSLSLAERLDAYAVDDGADAELAANDSPMSYAVLDDITAKRVLDFGSRVGRGYKAGERFAQFLVEELDLADGIAARLLESWNGDNRFPLRHAVLGELLAQARQRRAS
jgi:hypothetical protein